MREHDPKFMNDVLFVCTANKQRSATAEHVARKLGLRADSAGSVAVISIRNLTLDQIDHAHLIVGFEQKHVDAVKQLAPHRHVELWPIPDNYKYNQPELVQMLQCRIQQLLN